MHTNSGSAMRIEYIEIVTDDVPGVCRAYEEANRVQFGKPVAGLGNARTGALQGGGLVGVRAPMHEAEERVVRPYWLVDDIAAALGTGLYPLVLKLDADQPSGFAGRDWKPVNTGAAKHRARALQWFTFVIAALVIWLYLGFRRGAEQ